MNQPLNQEDKNNPHLKKDTKKENLGLQLVLEKKLYREESIDNELDEIRLDSYDNAAIYKDKMRKWHDKVIRKKVFERGDAVLLYNSRLRLFPGKLRSRWDGPYTMQQQFADGHVEVKGPRGNFIVNGQRLKHYQMGYVLDNDEQNTDLVDVNMDVDMVPTEKGSSQRTSQ
uniref:Uncharacterized protein n=1 Tax=Kalanchoe fedtschenkoi TaxID=63787 RepID=A0A7N0VBG7_KALFE